MSLLQKYLLVSLLFTVGVPLASAASVRPGARNVPVLRYALADCDSRASLESMTLVMEGGKPQDVRGVSVRYNGRVIARRKTVDAYDRTVTLRFDRRLAPKACSGESIDVVADLSRATKNGETFRFIVELPSDVVSDEGSIGIPGEGPWLTVGS